jgi:hypothetical protein
MENKMYFENAKVSEQRKVQGLFYYKVRHTDEDEPTMENYTVEKRVIVNRFCDLVCNFQIEELELENPNTDRFLKFKDFETKYLPELVENLEDLLQ